MPLVFSTVKWMWNYELGHETIVLIPCINSISIYTNKLCALPGSVRGAKDTAMNMTSWNLCSYLIQK